MLDKGTSFNLQNKAKELPIHCAARAGRAENVKVIFLMGLVICTTELALNFITTTKIVVKALDDKESY